MMHGWDSWGRGFMVVFPLLGFLVWIIFVGLIIVALVYLVRYLAHLPVEARPAALPAPDPVAVLKLRYARGEITREQYQQMLADLQGPGGAPPAG